MTGRPRVTGKSGVRGPVLAALGIAGLLLTLPLGAAEPPAAETPAAEADAGSLPPVPFLLETPDPGDLHVDPIRITEEMRRFVHEGVSTGLKPSHRLSALMDAVFGKGSDDLGVEYGSHETRTAAETFARRSGNCISFANLLVALAREAGLAAYFAEVDQVLAWDTRGEALIKNKHMVVEVEIENAVLHVDLVPDMPRYHVVRRISDDRAAAHYFNNLGVERLVEEGVDASLPYFRRALELAPEFAASWINLGVALRRGGRFDDAEKAYRRAIEIDRSERSAFSNLAFLYRVWGRPEEAEILHDRIDRYRRRNPFHAYLLGRQAVESGALAEAAEHFRDAVRREPEEARFHFALGDALYRAGELEKAEKSLRRAFELADGDDEREHYRRALEAVMALRNGGGGSGG